MIWIRSSNTIILVFTVFVLPHILLKVISPFLNIPSRITKCSAITKIPLFQSISHSYYFTLDNTATLNGLHNHYVFLVFHKAIGWSLIRSSNSLSSNSNSGMYSPFSNLSRNAFSSFVRSIKSAI